MRSGRTGSIALCVSAALMIGAWIWGAASGGRAVRAMTAEDAAEAPVLPVLMYHSIIDNQSRVGDYVITPAALRDDLEYLRAEGYTTVVMSDVTAYVEEGAPLPEKPVMLTFDDGYYNNYLYLFPLLREFGMKAVVSVIAAESEKFSAVDEVSSWYSHLTWDMIREMAGSGLVEFQNHSYNMHKYSPRRGVLRMDSESEAQYRQAFTSDVMKAQELLTLNCGVTPTVFTYPFGSYSGTAEELLTELGFKATLGVEGKVFRPTRDASCLRRIPRFNRPWGKTAKMILEKALG